MATARTDPWTEEQCIRLIREFKVRPVLWDKKDPFFYKKAVKPAAWEEIGNAMNIDTKTCRHKMVVLMSSFRREKSKILISLRGAHGSSKMRPYTSSWFAFKEMAFLMDKNKDNKIRAKAPNDSHGHVSTCSIKETVLKHHVQTKITNEVLSPRPSDAIRHELAKITEKSMHDETLNETASAQTEGCCHTQSNRDEEIISFTSFLAYKMKNYSDSTKNAVQQAICEIIFKADQQSDSSNIEKYTIIDAENGDILETSDCSNFNDVTVKMDSYSDSD